MLTRRMNRMFPELALTPEMDRIMNSIFTPHAAPSQGVTAVYPPLNIWEDESAFFVEAELPGYALSDIEISMTGADLTITGSRQESQPENAVVHRSERPAASLKFSRSIRVGVPVEAEKVSAKFDSGVLTITLPKSEAAKPRRIQVTAN